ncbi:MAG: hypothetical protein QME64_12490, partial [bacterium]|nr:hypothetical protein [bacterium]
MVGYTYKKSNFHPLQGRCHQLLNLIQQYRPTLLTRNQEAEELARMMVDHGMFSEKYFADALHVSYAVVTDLDILVSWNFEHLVRLNRRRMINAFGISAGYKPIEICTPEEVFSYEV